MIVRSKTKQTNIIKGITTYVIRLMDGTEINVSKEEYYLNQPGSVLKLESEVAYK